MSGQWSWRLLVVGAMTATLGLPSSSARAVEVKTTTQSRTASPISRPLTGPRAQTTQETTNDGQYWTAARLRAATPIPNKQHVPAKRQIRRSESPAAQQPPAGTPQAQFFTGVPTVGTFCVEQPSGNTSCTGSVVHSAGHNLVMTAAHCAASWNRNGSKRIFVPQYTNGADAADQPFGFFPVTAWYIDPRFSSGQPTAATTDLDFAFGSTSPNGTGQLIEDVTGALTQANTDLPEHSHRHRLSRTSA